jgi:transposase-like protein
VFLDPARNTLFLRALRFQRRHHRTHLKEKRVRAGRGVSELAREFGCNASSIRAWVKAAGGLDGAGARKVPKPVPPNKRQGPIASRRKLKQVPHLCVIRVLPMLAKS